MVRQHAAELTCATQAKFSFKLPSACVGCQCGVVEISGKGEIAANIWPQHTCQRNQVWRATVFTSLFARNHIRQHGSKLYS
eukprot:scaffold368743_cov22-Prasinocladus_malaysianus.AAC.1